MSSSANMRAVSNSSPLSNQYCLREERFCCDNDTYAQKNSKESFCGVSSALGFYSSNPDDSALQDCTPVYVAAIALLQAGDCV